MVLHCSHSSNQVRKSNFSLCRGNNAPKLRSWLMRVVTVDPSRTVLKFVARMLEAGHHEVRPFRDAQAALAHLESDPNVGALITSAELLTMSGVELCWEARLTVGRRPLYIIMMSSN